MSWDIRYLVMDVLVLEMVVPFCPKSLRIVDYVLAINVPIQEMDVPGTSVTRHGCPGTSDTTQIDVLGHQLLDTGVLGLYLLDTVFLGHQILHTSMS